jgi:hypothetical protein
MDQLRDKDKYRHNVRMASQHNGFNRFGGQHMPEADKDYENFVSEALRIVKLAEENGILLRIMGAVAIRYHCPTFGHLYRDMSRALTDLDFATYGKYKQKLKPFFTGLGYVSNEFMLKYYGNMRQLYYGQGGPIPQCDIFLDKIDMSHVVDFKGRLELDSPTLTLADLFLEKMQINKINEKDIKDTIIMLREHEVGDQEKNMVNKKYVAKALSDDWGFYYDVTTNIKKVKDYLPNFPSLSSDDKDIVAKRLDELVTEIEGYPKSFGWKMRARVGTSKQWYKEVEEVVRGVQK